MAKPRPKLVPKKSRPTPKPTAKAPAAKAAVRRTAVRRTRRPRPRVIDSISGPALVGQSSGLKEPFDSFDVPARTVARERALAIADELGTKLNKSALRRATDRIERVIKANRALPQAQPDADMNRKQPITLMGGVSLVPTHEKLPADMMGVHDSLRGLHGVIDGMENGPGQYLGIDRRPYLDAPRTTAPSNAPVSPFAQAIDLLDGRVSRAWGVVQRLEARLVPVSSSAPPNGSSGGADNTRPSNFAAAIEQIAAKVSGLGDFIETITDRLLV